MFEGFNLGSWLWPHYAKRRELLGRLMNRNSSLSGALVWECSEVVILPSTFPHLLCRGSCWGCIFPISRQEKLHRLQERLTPLCIAGFYWRIHFGPHWTLLPRCSRGFMEAIATILYQEISGSQSQQYCTEGFQGALQLDPLMPNDAGDIYG